MEQPAAMPLSDPDPLLPTPLAAFGNATHLRTGYPLLLAPDAPPCSLATGLQQWSEALGPGVPGQLLADNRVRLEAWVARNTAATPDAAQRLGDASQAMIDDLALAEGPAGSLREGLDALLAQVPEGARLVDYGPGTTRDLVVHTLQRRAAAAQAELRAELEPLRNDIANLLAVEHAEDATARQPETLALSLGRDGARFLDSAALSLVVKRKRGSTPSSQARIARLEDMLEELCRAMDDPDLVGSVVVCSAEATSWATDGAGVTVRVSTEPLVDARHAFEQAVPPVLKALVAARVARLELAGAYVAERHDPWVRDLSWQDLSAHERRWLPAVVVVHDARAVAARGLSALCALLGGDAPVQVVLARRGLQRPATDLARIAVALGTATVQRTTPAHPEHLVAGLEGALASHRPGLQVVFDGHLDGSALSPWLVAQAAVSGRAHTLFRFDPDAGTGWDSVMDVAGNPEPEQDWPVGDQDDPFTLAHAAWLDPVWRADMRAPTPDEEERLSPLADWLGDMDPWRLPTVALTGPDGPEVRVVGPALAAHVVAARQAWRLLRALGGVQNSHALAAEARVRTQASADADALRDQAVRERDQAVDAALAQGASDAMARLAASLLETDLRAPSRAAPPTPSEPVPTPTLEPEPEAAAPEPAPAPSEDSWIDSPLCTSCNDCLDINPQLFVYDANKQAEILDPSAGTFEELVRAAEKCPSACIHPGAPVDPDEPGLDALIERAEKFR